MTVVHHVKSNVLSTVQDDQTTLDSKPTAEASKSMMFERPRSSFSLISTDSTMNIHQNLSTFNVTIPRHLYHLRSGISYRRDIFLKAPPSPLPTGATPASDPNRNNLHGIATVMNHSNGISKLQNIASDLNASLLWSQNATSSKFLNTTFSLESSLVPTTPGHSPLSNQVPLMDAMTPNVPLPTMTFSTRNPKER